MYHIFKKYDPRPIHTALNFQLRLLLDVFSLTADYDWRITTPINMLTKVADATYSAKQIDSSKNLFHTTLILADLGLFYSCVQNFMNSAHPELYYFTSSAALCILGAINEHLFTPEQPSPATPNR